jgi:hypothetical protein
LLFPAKISFFYPAGVNLNPFVTHSFRILTFFFLQGTRPTGPQATALSRVLDGLSDAFRFSAQSNLSSLLTLATQQPRPTAFLTPNFPIQHLIPTSSPDPIFQT